MKFGETLELVKAGFRAERTGWNGKGMYIFYNPGSEVTVTEGRPLAAAYSPGTKVIMRPYIMMKTADPELTLVPWLASQSDILADDWIVLT